LNYFITGFHRAGTHSFAEELAKVVHLPYIEEGQIEWNDWEAVEQLSNCMMKKRLNKEWVYTFHKELADGFVLQCPMLASRVLDLAKIGKVYWCTRNHLDIITSMKNAQFNVMAWDITKTFHKQFPDDPIWNKLEGQYSGKTDATYGFVQYYTLVVKVKEYFYKKYFKDSCEVVNLEDRKDYNFKSSNSFKSPLRKGRLAKVKEVVERYESICVCQN